MRLSFINSIRALFPVWNFFDRISERFELWIKWDGVWIKKPSKNIKFYHLFLNPEGNRQLLEQSLLELFAQDLDRAERESVPALVSHRLISNIASQRPWKIIRGEETIYEVSA